MFWINWFIYHIWLKKLFIYESRIATSLMNMSRRDYHYELKKTNWIKCQIVFFGSAWQPHFFFKHIEKSSQDILKKNRSDLVKNDRICGLTSIMFTNLMRRSLSDGLHKHISALRPVPACPLSLGPESRCADCLSNPATRPGRSIIADSWRPGSRSVMMIK